MLLQFVPLLLPLAAASGWWMARRDSGTNAKKNRHSLNRDYIVGLNFLLNEEPDKAVDVFIKLLNVDSETVETHLALGNLFRRRGEVDRAIRLHQNLIARPQLDRSERIQALIELGRDYLSAGVFDRAERLFLEVAEMGGNQTRASLQYLLDIYQQEKDWQQAVEIAWQLEVATGRSMRKSIAHFYCELAELALHQGSTEAATKNLRRAQTTDKSCARAYFLMGTVELRERRYKAAVKSLKKALEQSPDIISEVLPALVQAYEQLEQVSELMDYLRDLQRTYPRIWVVLELSERIRKTQGEVAAAQFVADHLRHRPSLRGLQRLIELQLKTVELAARDDIKLLHELTCHLLAEKPVYRCESCGFSGKKMHWHCPGCKQWDAVKPIHGVEGD